MGKKLLGLLVAVLLGSSAIHAAGIDALVSFGGQGSNSDGIGSGAGVPAVGARFYIPAGAITVVTGGSVLIPNDSTGEELGFNVRGGVALDLPVVKTIEITGGVNKSTSSAADLSIGDIRLDKNVTVEIANGLRLGFTLNLVSINIDGNLGSAKGISFLEDVYPVVGATIDL